MLDAYKKCMSWNYIDAKAGLRNKNFMSALLKNEVWSPYTTYSMDMAQFLLMTLCLGQ